MDKIAGVATLWKYFSTQSWNKEYIRRWYKIFQDLKIIRVWKLIVNPEPVDDQDNGGAWSQAKPVAFIILIFI